MIIGFTGKAGAGKDTAASYFKNATFFLFFIRFKEICCFIFGLSKEQTETLKEVKDPRWGITPREIFQKVGKFIRSIDNNYFVNYLKVQLLNGTGKRIITDVRYDNEAQMIKELGGTIIKIVRPDYLSDFDNHESENGIMEKYVDVIIINDSTVENLHKKINLAIVSNYS